MPAYVGPLSALTVDDNRGPSDAAFLAEPALGHGETFRDLLGTVGVRVVGSVTRRTAPQGAVPVAGLGSPPLGELLARMLQSSDNEVAESLARGAGAELSGDSAPTGTAVLSAGLRDDYLPVAAEADRPVADWPPVCAPPASRRLVQWARAAVARALPGSPCGARAR